MATAEQQARWRARKKLRDSGLARLELWARPEHHAAIREYAEKLKEREDE